MLELLGELKGRIVSARLQAALPTSAQFASEYPAMSLVKLRIEIKRALRSIVIEHGLPVDSPMSIAELLEHLKRRGLAPCRTDDFVGALRVMNRAAHRVELDTVAVADAVSIGNEFLTEITASSQPNN
jgi:hypothetical protein